MSGRLSPDVLSYVDEYSLERAQSALYSSTPESLAQWAADHTAHYELEGQRFRMLVEPGENSDHAIVACGEYANGADSLGAIARLLTIRAMVDESATILLQPNSTANELNMNFSTDERRRLAKGHPAPIVDRLKVSLEKVDALKVTGYGPSQGGAVILAFGARRDVPPTAAAVVETPNVVSRTRMKLLLDFLRSGTNLKQNIEANFEQPTALSEKLIRELTFSGFLKYARGGLAGDNRALVGLMLSNTAAEDMKRTIYNHGSVMHAWASDGSVSPANANEAIADDEWFANNPCYASVELDNDHTVTNLYIQNAALTKYAFNLAAR